MTNRAGSDDFGTPDASEKSACKMLFSQVLLKLKKGGSGWADYLKPVHYIYRYSFFKYSSVDKKKKKS